MYKIKASQIHLQLHAIIYLLILFLRYLFFLLHFFINAKNLILFHLFKEFSSFIFLFMTKNLIMNAEISKKGKSNLLFLKIILIFKL